MFKDYLIMDVSLALFFSFDNANLGFTKRIQSQFSIHFPF